MFKWFYLKVIIIGFLLLALLAVSFVPLVARSLMVDWFAKQGVEVKFGQLELALLPARLSIASLEGRNAENRGFSVGELLVDIKLWPLLKRQLVVERFELENPRVDIQFVGDQQEIAGIDLTALAEKQAASQSTTKPQAESEPGESQPLQLSITPFAINDLDICIVFSTVPAAKPLNQCLQWQQLQMDQGLTLTLDQGVALDVPELIVSKLQLVEPDGAKQTLAVNRLRLEAIDFNGSNLEVALVELANVAADTDELLPESPVSGGEFSSLNLNQLAIREFDQTPMLTLAGATLDKLAVTQPQSQAALLDLAKLEITAIKADANQLALQSINLQSIGSHFGPLIKERFPAAPEQLNLSTIAINDLMIDELATAPAVALSSVGLDELAITRQQQRILDLQSLLLDGIDYRQTLAKVNRISLDQLALLGSTVNESAQKDKPGSLSFTQLQVSALEFSQRVSAPFIQAEAIELDGLHTLMRMNQQKELELVKNLQALFTPAQVQPPPASVEVTPEMVIRLNRFAIGGDSRLVWRDESIKPAVAQVLSELALTVGAIDSSNKTRKTPLNGQTTVGDFGRITFEGDMALFAQKLNLSITGKASGIDMQPLSPYAQSAIKHSIKQGQLSKELTLTVVDDQLDAEADILLHKFKVTANNGEESTEKDKEGSLPIGVALNLLRDKNDRVRLKLPVKGNINDPSISPNYIVGVVLRKALTQAVINYYTPFGLVSVAGAVFNSATKLRFNPIALTPGTDSLAAANTRLQELAKLLKEREKVSLVFCPTANAEDWRVLTAKPLPEKGEIAVTDAEKQQLEQLAASRAKAVKAKLIDLGVGADQVIICQLALDLKDRTQPQMTVNL